MYCNGPNISPWDNFSFGEILSTYVFIKIYIALYLYSWQTLYIHII